MICDPSKNGERVVRQTKDNLEMMSCFDSNRLLCFRTHHLSKQ
jgi:hypothetical protein